MRHVPDFVHEQSLKIDRAIFNLVARMLTSFGSKGLHRTVDTDYLF